MKRTLRLADVIDVPLRYGKDIRGWEPSRWLSDLRNIAFVDEIGNIALLEYDEETRTHNGHYFFISRGKQAVAAAQESLRVAFTGHDVNVIRGFTPLHKLGARWLSRHLGFTSYGVVHTHEPCELFILTKKEWENMHG